jgi:hypothetical protein
MAAFTRKQYSGAARNTTTTTLLTNVGTTVDIAATTGWPSIAGIPFYVVIRPSSIYEEKCLATISGSTLTLTRAQDDTTASEHPIGSVIYPVFTANDADEANELVSKLTTKGDLLVTDGTNLLRLGVGAEGYFLKASSSASAGVEWASIPTINSLNDIGDVTINNVEEGDFLVYKNSASAWINETIHFITVSDTEPTDEIRVGDFWYNSSELELYTYYSGSWIQVTLTPEFLTVEELDNVYIDNANAGDVLAFDGLDWYNDTVSNLFGSHIIALSGDVSGSVMFDGSASVNISTTLQPNSIALGVDTTGNYVNDLTAGTGVTVTHTPGEGSSPTVAIGQAVGTSASVTFANVTADLVGDVTGNASTASALETARTISLAGDLSGSASFNGTTDITISASVVNSGVSLDEISDVVITSPLNHQSLTYNGTNWVNEYAPTVTYARNAEANALSIGEVVYLFGAAGDRASVKRASNSSEATSSKTVGVVAVGGAAGSDVAVTTLGYVSGLSLGSYASGDVLWLGSTAGTFTTTKPTAPNHLVFIGVVTRANNGNGIMYVKCQNGYELEELHNVKINGVTDGQFLRYNSASALWVNDAINLGTDTVGNYMSDITQGTGVTITHTPGEGSNATIAIGQDVGTSASVTFSNVTATGTVTLAADPSLALQAATKQYVDNAASGINFHASVVAATSGNLAGTYNNGTAGVGATLTKATNGSIGTIDGASVVVGSRILVKSQTDSKQNGIYTITAVGSASAPWVITRATDADNSISGEMASGDFCFVMGGNTNAGYGFINNSSTSPIVIGTDNITYTAFNAAQVVMAGNGMAFSGTALNIGTADSSRIVVSTDDIDLATVSVSNSFQDNNSASMIFTGVEVDSYGRVTGKTAATHRLASTTAPGIIQYDGSKFDYSDGPFTIKANGIELGTDTTGNYMLNVSAGNGISISHTQGEGSTASVSTTGIQTLSAKAGNYTLAAGDAAETIIIMDSSSANDLTVPPASSVAFVTGTSITIVQRGTGKTRILAGAGVTLLATPGLFLRARYSSCTIVKTENANEWFVIGDLAAS